MKLVIDISEQDYETIKNSDKRHFYDFCSKEAMCYAIRNGKLVSDGWILMKDFRPEHDERVLCCGSDGDIFIDTPRGYTWYGSPIFENHDYVVAWRPLPEPYKGDVI